MTTATRTVDLDYLNELYANIERLNGEVAACHAVLNAVGRRHQGPVDDAVLDKLTEDLAAIDAGDLRAEDIENLTERQQEAVLLRARGLTWVEVGREMGVAKDSAFEIHARAVRAAKKATA